MRYRSRLFLRILALFLAWVIVGGIELRADESTVREKSEKLNLLSKALAAQSPKPASSRQPDETNKGEATGGYSERVTKKIEDSQIAALEHDMRMMKIIETALERQQFATTAMFFVVLVLVSAGLAFSAYQFRRMKGQTGINDISISKDGLQLKSSVLGVVILLFSFGFFYGYIRYVYPLTEMGVPPHLPIGEKAGHE